MKKILLADDDRMARGALRRALEAAEYEISEAENGKQAFELAVADVPDLIVTDLRMPEMDGQELLEAVRVSEWGKNLPVVMLTASEETEALNDALQSKVTIFFTKAMPLEDIVSSIKQLI